MITAENNRLARRWRPPALIITTRQPDLDEAGRSLESLARGILVRAPHVITACTNASHGPVECSGYTDVPQVADRAWRFMYDDYEVFCVLSESSERTLLGWLVGGWQAQELSSIERSIITEAMRRLLVAAPQLEIQEEPRVRPPTRAWRCDVRLRAGDDHEANLQLLTSYIPLPPKPRVPPDLRDVALHVRATLPGISCALADVSAWHPGALLPLQRAAHEISVGLYAGGRRLAVAQLGAVFGMRAVKLIAVGASSPR